MYDLCSAPWAGARAIRQIHNHCIVWCIDVQISCTAGLCLFSFLEWKTVDTDAQTWEMFKVWEHLVDQFPIFGQECDWQKFHGVMSRYQNDWRPFSGSGRKMVRVVVAERHLTKALHAPCANQPDPVDGDVSHDGQGPANYSRATFVGMLAPPKPNTTCSTAIFDLETAAASVASSLQGETSPPSSGQSPKGASDILDLLVAAIALRPRTVASFPAVTAPPHQTAVVERAPSSTTIRVADLLCPCPTVQTSAANNRKRQQVKSDVFLHDQRPHKLQKTCVLSRNDPLHLLLSIMDTQGCKDTNSN
mmetsp:Transcript_98369/g.144008  ORF Transcript_98369/g.144008 Transcript_98369/m.144008 type:complete len:305 (-) Transcript_98369:402-1316(-)